jgi:hypothetical protein
MLRMKDFYSLARGRRFTNYPSPEGTNDLVYLLAHMLVG